MNKVNNNLALLSAYVYIGLITIYYLFSISRISEEYSINSNIIIYCAIPFFILFIFLRQSTIKELTIFVVMFLIGIISSFVTKQATIILTATEVICCFSTDVKQTSRIMFDIEVFFLIFNMFLALTGIVTNEVVQYQRSFGGLIFRNSMGFSHYNGLGMVAFQISSLYMLGLDKIKGNYFLHVVGLGIFNLIIYIISGDRTAFFSFLLLIILISIFKFKKNNNEKILCIVADICLITFPLICTYGIVFLNEKSPNAFNLVNNIFQTRPFYILGYMNNYGIKLFGNNLKGPMSGLWGDPNQLVNVTLDSGFANMVITYGIIFAIIFILVMCKLVNKLKTIRRYSWIIYIIVICFYGLDENVLTYFTYNLCFMILPLLFINDKKKNNG